MQENTHFSPLEERDTDFEMEEAYWADDGAILFPNLDEEFEDRDEYLDHLFRERE